MDQIVYYTCAQFNRSFLKGKIISIRRWRAEPHAPSSRCWATRGYCPPRSQIFNYENFSVCQMHCVRFVHAARECVGVSARATVIPENKWKIESDRRRSDATEPGSIAMFPTKQKNTRKTKLRANNKIQKSPCGCNTTTPRCAKPTATTYAAHAIMKFYKFSILIFPFVVQHLCVVFCLHKRKSNKKFDTLLWFSVYRAFVRSFVHLFRPIKNSIRSTHYFQNTRASY